MVILKSQNKITDLFMILAWASPFNTNNTNTISLLLFWFSGRQKFDGVPKSSKAAIQKNESKLAKQRQFRVWRFPLSVCYTLLHI